MSRQGGESEEYANHFNFCEEDDNSVNYSNPHESETWRSSRDTRLLLNRICLMERCLKRQLRAQSESSPPTTALTHQIQHTMTSLESLSSHVPYLRFYKPAISFSINLLISLPFSELATSKPSNQLASSDQVFPPEVIKCVSPSSDTIKQSPTQCQQFRFFITLPEFYLLPRHGIINSDLPVFKHRPKYTTSRLFLHSPNQFYVCLSPKAENPFMFEYLNQVLNSRRDKLIDWIASDIRTALSTTTNRAFIPSIERYVP